MAEKSLALSLRNIYETFAISLPTMVEAARGTVTKEACDDRLEGWCALVLENAGVTLDVKGQEHVSNARATRAPFLAMSNHQSLYDIPVLFHVLGTNLRMVTKKELFRVPVFGKALAVAGFVSIDRSDRTRAIESLALAKRLLAEGTNVWIAPEGTRSVTGELLPFKKGGFNLALDARLPVLPVTLRGTRDILRAKGVRSTKGARVTVTIHPPIDPAPYVEEGKRGRDRLMADVRAALASAL